MIHALMVLFISFAATAEQPRVIYGADNRLDYYQIENIEIKSLANSTVALIRSTNLDEQGGWTQIRTTPYGTGNGLCPTEPFYEQETAAFCSGFLIAPDQIATAGHCIPNKSACDSTSFVFGFRVSRPGDKPRQVRTDQVFSCAEVIATIANPKGEDFAVVRLNRPVTHVQPLLARTKGRMKEGDELTVIGHPAGLPLKIAGEARVRSVQDQYFVANLDTYGGNSGSAVLNARTGEVEGILVRGATDYVYKDGCRVSNRCDENGCRGEDVTLFERVLKKLADLN